MSGRGRVTVHGSSGLGFAGALTIAFIVLKLTGVIDWAWVWVLAPLWVSFAFALLVLIAVLIVMAVQR